MYVSSRRWLTWGFSLALAYGAGAGCLKDSKRPAENPSTARAGSAGDSSSANTVADTTTGTGASSVGGAAGAAGGGSVPHFPVGTLEPLGTPADDDVPRPSESVSEPNLRVLPWAGFSAALSYTFDDTQPSQLEHWEELEATGIPMTFFANPNANWQAGFDDAWTAVAASGSEIGNHTWSHCHSDLSDCTPVGTAEEEIDEATAYIIDHFGVPAVLSFASPFGDSGWNEYAVPRFLVARGVQSGLVPATGVSNWHNLPIMGVSEGQTAEDFDAAIDNAHSQGRWGIFLFHSILPTSNNWYAGVEIADIVASIDYALGLEDVWIERIGVVGAYARAQQMLEAVTPSDNRWTWTLPERYPHGGVLRVSVDGGTLSQGGSELSWDPHGYFEVDLDAGELSWSP